jgi:hypothetical protein
VNLKGQLEDVGHFGDTLERQYTNKKENYMIHKQKKIYECLDEFIQF